MAFRYGSDFLSITPNTCTKKKIDKLDLIKIIIIIIIVIIIKLLLCKRQCQVKEKRNYRLGENICKRSI